jgi:uncharacterized iron-regulated protein
VTEPIQLVPGKSDKEIAEELKAEIIETSKAYLAVITKAHRLGFHVQMGSSPNAFGEVVIQQLVIAKHY